MPRRGDGIYKRKDGRWEGRFRYFSEEGKGKYKSVYGKSYREVKEKRAALMQDIEAITDIAARTEKFSRTLLPFCSVMEEWLLYIRQTRKYSTYMRYLSIYECHIKETFRDADISDISDAFINKRLSHAYKEGGLSDNMRHSILAVINQSLQYACECHGYPVLKLKNAANGRKAESIEIINYTEQSRLLPYLYTDTDISKAGIILCLSTGLRLGEICSLKWEDIDFANRLVHVNRTVQRIAVKEGNTRTTLMETPPKSGASRRQIPLPDAVCQFLEELKENREEYFLCGSRPMEPRTYQNHFKRYLKETGIKDYNFHALRHTFATNCIDQGMDVKSLSEILGHANIKVTFRYVHPAMEMKRKYINTLASVYGQFCGQKY